MQVLVLHVGAVSVYIVLCQAHACNDAKLMARAGLCGRVACEVRGPSDTAGGVLCLLLSKYHLCILACLLQQDVTRLAAAMAHCAETCRRCTLLLCLLLPSMHCRPGAAMAASQVSTRTRFHASQSNYAQWLDMLTASSQH